MEIKTKYGIVKIFAKTIEDEAVEQITTLANSVLGVGANVRIMPDAHVGAGCVIGTTMIIADKVCPNLVGVDIGCGVDLVQTDIDFAGRLSELDEVVRMYVPYGKNHHAKAKTFRDFSKLKCWDKLKSVTKETAIKSLGTLGGGNHFIEAYSEGYLAVHSGSRNIGWRVAQYYQLAAEKQLKEKLHAIRLDAMAQMPEKDREQWLRENKAKPAVDTALAYLTGDLMDDYLHDMSIMQDFAVANRKAMLGEIVSKMGGSILSRITSTHNYIDMSYKRIILRKGAISARSGEELVIPLNMRDGLLVCVGKGNKDWNYSAPHGAGRLYSRSKAKQILKIDDYKKSMQGIFSTCINADTLDEAPFAYKDYKEIMQSIEPTAEIKMRLIPIYNFKASE